MSSRDSSRGRKRSCWLATPTRVWYRAVPADIAAISPAWNILNFPARAAADTADLIADVFDDNRPSGNSDVPTYLDPLTDDCPESYVRSLADVNSSPEDRPGRYMNMVGECAVVFDDRVVVHDAVLADDRIVIHKC